MKETWSEARTAQWLRDQDGVLILTHIRPDGDTLGCAAALCAALRKLGKRAWVLKNPGVTDTYEAYVSPCYAPADVQPEHIVAVDIATEDLLPAEFEGYRGRIELCIDHHPSNTGYAGATCLDPSAAACGEILFRILRDHLGLMDGELALALYVAVSTDCGCFVYSNTTPETHRIAACLMEHADVRAVNKRCFRTKSRKRLQLEGMLMASEEFFDQGRLCIGVVSVADKVSVDASEGDCEELSSFAAEIEGVLCAATIRQLREGVCKISLRTDPDYCNATEACALLGGGGHAAAAGATLYDVTIPQAREQVYRAVTAVTGR